MYLVENDHVQTGQPGIGMRTEVVQGQPLAIASLPVSEHTRAVRDAITKAQVPQIDGFVGQPLPMGARLGMEIDSKELRVVDEQSTVVLRASRKLVNAQWYELACRRRGTMFVVVYDIDLAGLNVIEALVETIEKATTTSVVHGAIIGVIPARSNLPLLF